jgi:putative tricarboxylic transport membrane protein
MAFFFGVLGYYLMKYKFPRVSLIIALILGYMAEKTFFQSIQIARGSYTIFFERPISLLLFTLAILSFTYPYIRNYRKRKKI